MTVASNRKLYETACGLLAKYKEDESIDLKKECRNFTNTNNKERKKIASLVFNYLNHKDEVKSFKKMTRIKCKKRNLDDHLVRMMLTEMLYSPCYVESTFEGWKEMNYLNNFVDQINNRRKTIVLRTLPAKQEKRKVNAASNNDNVNDSLDQRFSKKKSQKLDQHFEWFKDVKKLPVKYLHVNRLKTTVDDLVYELVNDLGYVQVGRKFDCFNDFLKKLFNLKEHEFMLDYHFDDDLIVVNACTKKKFQQYRMYQDGKVIFQDKASLFPLKCANLTKGMRIADVCCAPGMKTFAISSMLENDCQIISVDVDTERIETMKILMDKLGVRCSRIVELDFTKTTLDNFKFDDGSQQIDVLFLDPSCSGSGMIDRRNEGEQDVHSEVEDRKRLMKLASFQTHLLCHAMSLGPKLIVYSTCSFSVWENEFVVCKSEQQAANAPDYELIDAFPGWSKRGDPKFTCADKVLRTEPSRGTRGFFTAVFKRKK